MMGSPDTGKKGVPEWLNSSLWSSPRASPSPSQPSPSPSPSPLNPPRPDAEADKSLGDPARSDAHHTTAPTPQGKNGLVERTPTDAARSKDHSEPERPLLADPSSLPTLASDEEEGAAAAGETSDLFLSSDAVLLPSPLLPSSGPLSPNHLGMPVVGVDVASSAGVATASVMGSSSFDSRVSQFNSELSKDVINIKELRRLASQGIPDSGSIRATTWKLLLGYLPKRQDLRMAELKKKREEYESFKEELLVTPSEVTRRKEEAEALNILSKESPGLLPRHDISHDDHPLSLGKSSIWHQFFVEAEVCEQIDRDVKRTHPDMHFFCGDSVASLENQEAMKRVLFIFSKLNPGIRYVQGMNEVLAPLYFVFRTDADETNSRNAEADCFFCFVALLGDFRDHFVQQLDNSAVGIRSTIARLNALLRKHDEELWRHLEFNSKVNPQFYAFRWITLLLTQEFTFPDSLRLWDSLLANSDGPLEILLRVCCSMLMSVRSRLLAGDFTANLKLLQHYPSIDIHHLLRVANDLNAKELFSG